MEANEQTQGGADSERARETSRMVARARARFAEREKAAIENRTPITPPVVFEVIRRAGEQELVRPASALVASGLAAGLAIGFSVLAQALLRAHLPEADWRPLVESVGYAAGFVIVILGQMQLFTENTITVVCPALERPFAEVYRGVARLWSLVLAANLAGACAFGVALYLTRGTQPEVWQAVAALATKATAYGFWEVLWRGIGAGWLIAAMVWIMATAGRAQFALIVTMTTLIALADFSHIVAGATEAAALVAAGELGVGAGLGGFLLPALIGNILGGTVLFTLLTWAQIRAELPLDPDAET